MNRCYVKSVVRLEDEMTDLKEWITPAVSRRLGRILKRAVAASFLALRDAHVDVPDGIITATGVGCMENSEKFLYDMLNYGEGCLKPTLFMQSTHNTISSQIAILLKCNGYNTTYSHKGSSFASALLDGLMQIENGYMQNLLVGSFDEVTPFMERVMKYTHPEFKKVTTGAVSSVISSDGVGTLCEIEDVEVLRHPDREEISRIVSENNDGWFYLGMNGNQENDASYAGIIDEIGNEDKIVKYREIYGDSFSSPAYGYYAAISRIGESSEIKRITVLDFSDEILSVIRLKSVAEEKR